MKTKIYRVENNAGWFVCEALNKREAKSEGIKEFGRGSGSSIGVSLASDDDIRSYRALKGAAFLHPDLEFRLRLAAQQFMKPITPEERPKAKALSKAIQDFNAKTGPYIGSPEHNAYYDVDQLLTLCLEQMTPAQIGRVAECFVAGIASLFSNSDRLHALLTAGPLKISKSEKEPDTRVVLQFRPFGIGQWQDTDTRWTSAEEAIKSLEKDPNFGDRTLYRVVERKDRELARSVPFNL